MSGYFLRGVFVPLASLFVVGGPEMGGRGRNIRCGRLVTTNGYSGVRCTFYREHGSRGERTTIALLSGSSARTEPSLGNHFAENKCNFELQHDIVQSMTYLHSIHRLARVSIQGIVEGLHGKVYTTIRQHGVQGDEHEKQRRGRERSRGRVRVCETTKNRQ